MDRNCNLVTNSLKDITLVMVNCLYRNYEAFLHHQMETAQKAAEINAQLDKDIKQQIQKTLKNKLVGEIAINQCSDALTVLSHLEKINYNLGKINELINNKISDGIIFSEKAAAELGEVFIGAGSLLQNIHDAMITDNDQLIKHVIKNSRDLWEQSREFANEHEDRLIKGICLPKASFIYLLTLDSLKDILWYEREIGKIIN